MNKVEKYSAGMIAVAGVLAASGSFANDTDTVLVNIEVAQEVSLWADDNNISIILQGNNPENSDAVASSLGYISNVESDISAEVTGSMTGTDGDINFFIFDQSVASDESAAINAIAGNANNPPGALKWVDSTLGNQQTLVEGLAESYNVSSRGVVYAASAPNVLPAPDDYELTVTWTIAPSL